MNKIGDLEEQNKALATNYKVVKDELVDTRKKYNEAKENYMQTVQQKLDAEKQNESFIDSIKSQLLEKTKDFEQLRDKFVPHDIDQLRIKVQEELEIQHRQQIHAVECDLEKQREQFYNMRREYERGKAEYEMLIHNLSTEITAVKTDREAVESSLRAEIVKLKDVEYTPGKDEKIRTQKAKITELTHLIELIRDEARTHRQERDEVTHDLETLRVTHEEMTTALKGRIAILEAQQAGLEERVSRINTEGEKKDAQIRTYRMTAEDLADRLDHITKTIAESEKAYAILKDDYTKNSEQTHLLHESEKTEMQDEIESLMTRLNDREEIVRRAQREASDMQVRAESVVAELRRTHSLQMQDLKKKLGQTEIDFAEARNSQKLIETQLLQSTEQFTFEKDSLRSEVSRVKREKDILLSKLREMELASDADKRALSTLKQDSTAKLSIVENRLKEVRATNASLEIKLTVAHDRIYEMQNANQSSKEAYTKLEQRIVEQLAVNEAMKREFQHQLDVITPTVNERLESLKQKSKSALQKEKRRSEAYKAKALEAHSRVKSLLAQEKL